jgi:Ca-activated chloride channel family protein
MKPRRLAHTPRTPHPRHTITPCRLFVLLLFALLSVAPRVVSQTPTATPPEDEEILTVSTDLITASCFVTDSRGRRVTGLAREDFQVRDNERPVAISYFAPGTSRVALVFALDASGSVRENIARQRETALALLSRFGKGSRAAVVAFAERPLLALPFTQDAAQVRAAFEIDAQPNHHTAIFDATLAALRSFDAGKADAAQRGSDIAGGSDITTRRDATVEQRGDAAERRIVVLISDGLDNVSAARPASVAEEARARGVSIYVIHFPLYEPHGAHLAVRAPTRGFRELAERTGGTYFLLGNAARALDPSFSYDLTPVFKAIADDLQSQYELGFYPDEAARKLAEHKLEVSLVADKTRKLRVHTLRDRYTLKP